VLHVATDFAASDIRNLYQSSLLLGFFLASSLLLDLTGLGGLPGASAPAGIALGIMGSTRPSHHVEVITLWEGKMYMWAFQILRKKCKTFDD
jgi:hypothetical protein